MWYRKTITSGHDPARDELGGWARAARAFRAFLAPCSIPSSHHISLWNPPCFTSVTSNPTKLQNAWISNHAISTFNTTKSQIEYTHIYYLKTKLDVVKYFKDFCELVHRKSKIKIEKKIKIGLDLGSNPGGRLLASYPNFRSVVLYGQEAYH